MKVYIRWINEFSNQELVEEKKGSPMTEIMKITIEEKMECIIFVKFQKQILKLR